MLNLTIHYKWGNTEQVSADKLRGYGFLQLRGLLNRSEMAIGIRNKK